MKRIEDRDLLDTYHAKLCAACGCRPSDPCHIRSRGAGGPDLPWNIIALCRTHHTEQHKIGWDRMMRKYPQVRMFMIQNGWTKLNGRLWNPGLEKS
jgi:hypothetical protein